MITREIRPHVDAMCRVSGFIYEADSPQELGEDMLDVVLPNGILITAGWYPEGAPRGTYRVSVFRDYDELIPPLESTEADCAARDVEQLVHQWIDRNIYADSATTHDPSILSIPTILLPA